MSNREFDKVVEGNKLWQERNRDATVGQWLMQESKPVPEINLPIADGKEQLRWVSEVQ